MLKIDVFSDVLCIWALISQKRIDELEAKYGSKIAVNYRFMDVFGNTEQRIGEGWKAKNGYAGFHDHVVHSAAPYEYIQVHKSVWLHVKPTTSFLAHAVARVVLESEQPSVSHAFVRRLRCAFFEHGVDISDLDCLKTLAVDGGIEWQNIDSQLQSGRAFANVLLDYQEAKTKNLQGSPSIIINEGRQTLYGNVGYRVLSANIEELLNSKQDEASWC